MEMTAALANGVQAAPAARDSVVSAERSEPAVVQAGYSAQGEVELKPGAERMPPVAAGPGATEESAAPPVPSEPLSPFPRGEAAPRRKSYVDLTASPCFGHATDYSWLRGQAEYSRIRHGWRLRYASVDEVDRYGGSVTLIENRDLERVKDGQYITVHGHVSSTGEDGATAAYRVDSFEVVTNPNVEGAK
jgi:hypothetical protein